MDHRDASMNRRSYVLVYWCTNTVACDYIMYINMYSAVFQRERERVLFSVLFFMT